VSDQVFEPIVPCLARIVRPRLTLYRGVMNIPYGGAGNAETGGGTEVCPPPSCVEWNKCREGIIPR